MYTIVFAFVQVWCTSLSGYGMWPNPIGNGNIPAWQPPTSLRKIETRIPGWRHAAHTCVFYWSASIRALLWHDFWILISILPYHAQRQHSFHFSKKARVVTWHIHTHTLYSCCSYCRRRIINLSFRLAFFLFLGTICLQDWVQVVCLIQTVNDGDWLNVDTEGSLVRVVH